ncbi:hypothetical protein M430DRAFT_133318 [Amorphotheca resinae ATCC 22711]|uniref:ATP synthase F(0) complex subunit e, mitochondrial n=1 Tax=Amorphotheca resinae ATCC 22711 TaxID=857342 RepID=A0A2T3B9X9_AMORE|nr:hypothetical protein M430DRAFT_133318 [Amorphotheca resinae ATCC 22711]PSS25137.1 hypothetical protein M430DRAFT_133318 [Amorphotheca resinae ATCC 22711]
MASTGLNVARYSALGFGIIYGLYHQAQLSSAAKLAALDREYQHKQSLIEKAKAEYSKKSQQSNPKTGSVVSDPEDSQFDLEAFLNSVAAESK